MDCTLGRSLLLACSGWQLGSLHGLRRGFACCKFGTVAIPERTTTPLWISDLVLVLWDTCFPRGMCGSSSGCDFRAGRNEAATGSTFFKVARTMTLNLPSQGMWPIILGAYVTSRFRVVAWPDGLWDPAPSAPQLDGDPFMEFSQRSPRRASFIASDTKNFPDSACHPNIVNGRM